MTGMLRYSACQNAHVSPMYTALFPLAECLAYQPLRKPSEIPKYKTPDSVFIYTPANNFTKLEENNNITARIFAGIFISR